MNQSIYIHSHIETPHGVRRLNAGGIWRFRPSTHELDVFARGFINPWGTAWNTDGAMFATDGAHYFGITPIIRGAYYPTAQGSTRFLEGLNPGSPKHCGLEVIGGSAPAGRASSGNHGHQRLSRPPGLSVRGHAGRGRFVVPRNARLIKTTHPAFRPIDVKMGPDGAIYIADWYNPIIQHGEVDFRDPRRDKTHGRIWRITAKDRPLVPKPKLVGASIEELLEQLNSPEQWTRDQARRVLTERGAEAVAPKIPAWMAKTSPASRATDTVRRRTVAVPIAKHRQAESANAAFTSTDTNVRAAACRVAGAWADRLPNALALLAPLVGDADPMVRLEAVRALAAIPSADAAVAAAGVLDSRSTNGSTTPSG